MMKKTSVFGYFELFKVRSSNDYSSLYYNIWLLATSSDDVVQLTKLSKNKDMVKCCFNYDGMEINKNLTGFGRVIQYSDTTGLGQKPEHIVMMFEGQVENG